MAAEKPLMVVGIDESDHSFYALNWTIDHFFAPYAPNYPFKLILVHAKSFATSALGLAGPGAVDVLPFIEADLKKVAARVLEKAKAICVSKQLFYCEICDAKGYITERTKPVLKGWDTTKLRARVYHEMKMGAFGLGKVRRTYRKGMKKSTVEKKRCDGQAAETSMPKEKRLAQYKNKEKVKACAKDHDKEGSSNMRVDKTKKRGKKRKYSSCAENLEETSKIKAKSKTLSEEGEEMEIVDLSLDADTTFIGSLIKDNSVLHIQFEAIESRRQTLEEEGWERTVVEDGDSEIQEVLVDDEGSEQLHGRSTKGVEAPSFAVQDGGEFGVQAEVCFGAGEVQDGGDVEAGGDVFVQAGVCLGAGGVQDGEDVGVEAGGDFGVEAGVCLGAGGIEDGGDGLQGEVWLGAGGVKDEGVGGRSGKPELGNEQVYIQRLKLLCIGWRDEQGEEGVEEAARHNVEQACIEEVRCAAQQLSDAMMYFDSVYGEALMKYPHNKELKQIDRDLMIQMGMRGPPSGEDNYRTPQAPRKDEFRQYPFSGQAPAFDEKRKMVVSDKAKSPYVERITNIHNAERVVVKRICDWLFSVQGEEGDIVYQYLDASYERVEFESLDINKSVMHGVISSMRDVLNHEEDARSKESPYRFYFTLYVSWVLGMESAEDDYEVFKESVENELGIVRGDNLLSYDMLFFPMNRINHYYLLVVNLKNPAVEILDNDRGGGADITIYGNSPSIMKSCLCRYLQELGYRKSIILERCSITKPKLRWATSGNERDSGVFLMRHMETYMGLKGKTTWKTQLGFEGKLLDRQIIKLRRLFAWKILTSPVNRLANSVIAKAKKFAEMGQHEK